MTDNTKPTFVVTNNLVLAEAKVNGSWPLAPITFLKAEKPDVNGAVRVYYVEVVTDVNAPWVTKGSTNEQINQGDLEDLKHVIWAAVEVFHQHRNTIMELGCHILDVDMSKTPEREVGAIAAWCTHPRFSKFAPDDGWVGLTARNIAGNIRYIVGNEPLPEGQATKYDYEDMMLAASSNFRLFVPPFLHTPAYEGAGTWMDTVIESLTLGRDASIAASQEAALRYNVNQTTYQKAKVDVAVGNVPTAESLIVVDTNGKELDLKDVDLGSYLYVYIKTGGGRLDYIKTIKWDASPMACALVGEYRRNRVFSTVSL